MSLTFLLSTYYIDATIAFYRTENLLIAERRTAAQLREYINQMELDLKSQTNLANELLIVNKETEVKYKMQVCDRVDGDGTSWH